MISERTMRVLEFTRIREMLAEGALTEAGAEKCRALTPMDDAAQVAAAQAETEEARTGPIPSTPDSVCASAEEIASRSSPK